MIKALSEDDVQEKEITLSIDWVTYYELIGVVGNAPEDLPLLAQGIFPFSANASSSTTSTRERVRRFRGAFRGIAASLQVTHAGCDGVGPGPSRKRDWPIKRLKVNGVMKLLKSRSGNHSRSGLQRLCEKRYRQWNDLNGFI